MKTRRHISLFILFLGLSLCTFSQDEIDILILNKDYDEAIHLINSKLEVNPSVNLYFKKGIAYSNLQNYQEALGAYSEALVLDPDNVPIVIELAENLSTLGNQEDAEEFFLKAIQLEPENLTLKAKLGRVYINQKKTNQAYNLFSEIYEIDSVNVFWNKQFAYCCFQLGEEERAIRIYENVLKANPRDHKTYINLVHAYNWKRDGDSILAVIDQGLIQFPENSDLFLERANFYFKKRNYENARKDFENYFTASGDQIFELVMNYGISVYFSGDENEAMKIFDDLFIDSPNDPFVMYYKALCYKKMHNLVQAAKYMEWAIDASYPEYLGDFYHHLGQIYGLDRKFEESIAALRKVNELNPKEHEVLFEIATTFEEFNNNKTLALNYYQLYLKEAGESGRNTDYALTRITRIKEDMFFDE